MAQRPRNSDQNMETATPFDLNQAIQRWRENLGQSPAFRRENLDELGSHLRDSIAALQTRGLSAEEAFMVATKRVGRDGLLEAEFGKVNRKSVWLDRVLWMLIGIQVWGLASSFTGSIARNALAFGWKNTNYNWKESGMALPVALFALVQVVAVAASVGFCWWLIIRKGGKLGAWFERRLQRRAGFVACGIALCMLSIFVNGFSSGLQALLFWSSEPAILGETMMYSNYSQLIVSPFQVVAMIAATLVLARRRLRLRKA